MDPLEHQAALVVQQHLAAVSLSMRFSECIAHSTRAGHQASEACIHARRIGWLTGDQPEGPDRQADGHLTANDSAHSFSRCCASPRRCR
jgi:hypothetical protein